MQQELQHGLGSYIMYSYKRSVAVTKNMGVALQSFWDTGQKFWTTVSEIPGPLATMHSMVFC